MSESMMFFLLYTGVVFLVGLILGYYLESLYLQAKAYRVRRRFRKKAKVMR